MFGFSEIWVREIKYKGRKRRKKNEKNLKID